MAEKTATFRDELKKSLKSKENTLIRTEPITYTKDLVDVLAFLIQEKKDVLIITFDTTTREIMDSLKFTKKQDISNIYIIDAVSIYLGTGTPPVEKLISVYSPEAFGDIEVYTALFFKQVGRKNSVIVFISLDKLEVYKNCNEAGYFLQVFGMMIKKAGVPEILMSHSAMSFIMTEILSRHVDKVIPFKSKPIIEK